ncbi:MAG: protein DedD [Mesorhizobium sp.]|nr:MAG: protein DedD [Mesorhizobium sp.]TIO36199.1 MAG: protein DedD [Mesorhizobium sp.]TIP11198.1 MAG: protein DedD [Mesorhizobium sp.]
MWLKGVNGPGASMRPEERSAKAAVGADFRCQASVPKTRQKCSRLSSPCAAPVTGRP